jgi:DNA-directed RNA polymerase beta subunit
MPYDDDGIVPDVVVNPHGIPGRMPIGQICESAMQLIANKNGGILDATAFNKISTNSIAAELTALGITDFGMRYLTNGRTGERNRYMTFITPSYFLRLQKFVVDQTNAISRGAMESFSRQPVSGRAAGGGQRIGEMEKDAFIAHGIMAALKEKFYNHSDGFDLYVCKRCGHNSIYNAKNGKNGTYDCKLCGDLADIARTPSSWMSNIVKSEIVASNIEMRYLYKPLEM